MGLKQIGSYIVAKYDKLSDAVQCISPRLVRNTGGALLGRPVRSSPMDRHALRRRGCARHVDASRLHHWRGAEAPMNGLPTMHKLCEQI